MPYLEQGTKQEIWITRNARSESDTESNESQASEVTLLHSAAQSPSPVWIPSNPGANYSNGHFASVGFNVLERSYLLIQPGSA